METNERPLAAVSDVAFSDSVLVAAIRAGNHDALTALYERYGNLVFRASNRMLDDASAAEDVVQRVFLSLWSTPPLLTGNNGSLAAWFVMVAKNRTRDVLRTRAARREANYPLQLVDAGNLDEIVDRRWQHARIRAAVAALPASQRTLIELGFYGERTHAELAELMQLPLGTIKTRIRSGLRKLRWSCTSFDGESA